MIRFLFAFITILFFACSEKHEATIEEELYDALEQSFHEEGKSLSSVLDKIETAYIDQGILNDKSGQSKLGFYEQISISGKLPKLEDQSVYQEIELSLSLWKEMHEREKQLMKEDSLTFVNSQYYSLFQGIHKRLEMGNLDNIVIVADEFISEIDQDEFEQPFYRAYMLLSTSLLLNNETAYIKQIPKKIHAPTLPPMEERIVISNPVGSEVLIDSEEVSLKQLPQILGEKLMQDDSKHVCIRVRKSTSYGIFAQMQASIEAAYSEIFEREAQRSFHKHFDDLTPVQQEDIKSAHPMKIIESPIPE